MTARFKEVSPNRGVDDVGLPIPEMVVPLRGTNHVLLVDGDGLEVVAETPNMVHISEVKGLITQARPKPRTWELKGLGLPDNPFRRHSSIGMISPAAYEERYRASSQTG